VKFSPAGERPDGVVRTGLGLPSWPFAGVAGSSGISLTLLRLRSTASALSLTLPPLVQLTSPATVPFLLS
jgi:hypothetical protein